MTDAPALLAAPALLELVGDAHDAIGELLSRLYLVKTSRLDDPAIICKVTGNDAWHGLRQRLGRAYDAGIAAGLVPPPNPTDEGAA